MIVEQIDAFKTWLTAVLKPMCEADPGALAKYVLALIKKDKSEEELRKSMIGQLDVFLEGETENFVNLVFQTLETKDYINTPVIPNANPPNPMLTKALVKDVVKDAKVIVSPSELPNLSESVNGGGGGGGVKKVEEVKRDRELRKNSDGEKTEEKPRRRSRHRSLSRNRSRTRSRSWDRSKRSRSRSRPASRDRDQQQQQQHRLDREKRDPRPRTWRNKSPPPLSRSSRCYDRRRSRSVSPLPRHSSRRYRRSSGQSRSRTRSRSVEKQRERGERDRDRDRERGERSRAGTPTQDSNHGDLDLRLTNTTQSIASVVVNNANNAAKRRCRDFDEKGYCMRGETCPFDHGMDPVVLEDAALRVLTYNPNGAPTDGVPPQPGMIQPEYNPQAPQIWNRGGFRGGPPRLMGQVRAPPPGVFQQQQQQQRELIPVPVMDNKQPQDQQQQQQQQQQYTDTYKKKQFDFARLGPRSRNPSNCSLELKKVPQGLNSITHLNNHFSKFGKIVNIQVQYEGDSEGALVTFSSHAEANAAYRSTEAVLNNRFIKVFWHNNNNAENLSVNKPVKERLGATTNKVLNLVQPKVDDDNKDNQPKDDDNNKEESKAQATAAIKKNQDLLAVKERIKRDQDEQRKEVLKIKNDLMKRKQELLDKQLMQQRKLIDKMEKLQQGAQRDLIKETLKKSQESIEAIKKDLEQATLNAKLNPPKKTKEDAQKEMLDMELDLITKQQEGLDTTDIQRRILELRTKLNVGRGRGNRGRGRYAPPIQRHLLYKNNLVQKPVPKQKHTLDHRTTKLLISGFETDDPILPHFQQFGTIIEHTIDSAVPSVTLSYKTRKEAEMALLKGKHFQDRTLSITWVNASLPSQRMVRGQGLMSESEEDRLIDQSLLEGDEELGPEISEEVLLQDDEEEDEENEDRSWRR